MTEQNEAYTRLKNILKELFQLDQADLDFGIYRIMNQKRDEVTDFLENRLVTQVKDVLDEHADKDKDKLREELESLKKTLTDAGVDVSTNEKVQQLERQVSQADTTDLQNSTFSHLTNFFKRYYKEGDFISQRRYKDDVYAIPYQGEEVKLHWANHDQYYIKTSEYFKNYRFKLRNGKWINFELLEASTEQNNNKSQNGDRKFKLAEENIYSEDGDTLTIYFTYEPMSKKKKQDKLMSQAFETIKEEVPSKWLTELLQPKPTEKNKKRTLLEKHLKDYTARNTFDYFIHKDLGKFLRRELDFYVKNEILHIDDIDLDKDESYREALQVIKAFKKVGLKVIDFLTQLEEFQKKLWLKKKFVLQSDYCITLDRIDEEFYEEIAANDKQRKEWIELYAIDELDDYSEPLNTDFLKDNLFLMVDTQFYSREWKYDLLATIDHLDDQTGGLMINSENFQALSFLNTKFQNKIDGIHIDPPYNTETSGFNYKNNYQHSSWLSLMWQGIDKSLPLLHESSSFQCHIDENEYEKLYMLFDKSGIPDAGTVVWNKMNPMLGRKGVATQHEYVIFRSNLDESLYARSETIIQIVEKAKELIKKHDGDINKAENEYQSWLKKQKKFTGGDKAYKYIEDDGTVFRGVAMGAPEKRTNPKYFKPLIHPKTGKECPVPSNGWSRTPETLQGLIESNDILWGDDHTTQPQKKVYLSLDSKRQLSSIIDEAKSGKYYLDDLGYEFPYSHPVSLYEKLISALSKEKESFILDYFAGSGTTGHAVIDLNKGDSGKRKYIMVEMGSYFNAVTKPRIQKVIYSDKWKNGNPVDREGISHMFKYLRLESYEDTLNTLSLSRSEQQQQLLANEDLKEEYILNYMLDVEAKESLLNTEMFKQPFGYSIKATEHNERVPTEVDLVETFNYLIGLHVVSIQMIKGYVVVTGRNNGGEHILVIWRDTEKHSNEDLEKFVNTMEFNPLDGEFDTIYVNGDNNLQNLRKDEDTWKVRLIEEEFHKRMFETEGL